MTDEFLADGFGDEEITAAREFVNPDDEGEVKFGWDYDQQQYILGMLLTDRHFLIQSVNLVKPGYFVRKAHERICEVLFRYFNKYRALPSRQFIANELKGAMKGNPQLGEVLAELAVTAQVYEPGLASREYLLDRMTEFAKEQSLREAFSKSLDLLQGRADGKWAEIGEVLKKALLTDRSFDAGLDYFSTLSDRYDRMAAQKENKEVFDCVFSGINDALSYGGLCRGEIGAIIALPGVGKSVFLVQAAVSNLLTRRKRVCYISTEMDPDKIARRFDAILSNHPIWELEKNRDDIIDRINGVAEIFDDKSRLMIKQFPAGTADVNTIRAYLTQMKIQQGFSPDMVVVDYVGELKDAEGVKTYESRQRAVRDLRALAVEEQICVLTAMQPDRAARAAQEEGHIDDHNLADSFGQARPLDAMWTMNQSEAEKSQKIGRIWVAKHRDGKSRFQVYYKQDPATLALSDITEDVWKQIKSEYVQKKVDGVVMKEHVGKPQKKGNS